MNDYSELKKAAQVVADEYSAPAEYPPKWPDGTGNDWFEIGPRHTEMGLVKRCSPTAVLEMIAELAELAELLRQAREHIPQAHPLRSLIDANLMQYQIERGPKQ